MRILPLLLILLLSFACSPVQITPDQCATICGGDGQVCSYTGSSAPGDGVCVCRNSQGQCPQDVPLSDTEGGTD